MTTQSIDKWEQRKCASHGYTAAGYWDDLYRFQKCLPGGHFMLASATEWDLLSGNINDMLDLGLTRPENKTHARRTKEVR